MYTPTNLEEAHDAVNSGFLAMFTLERTRVQGVELRPNARAS
jgi:hypothetical protein